MTTLRPDTRLTDDDDVNIPPGQGPQYQDLHLLDQGNHTHRTTDDTTDKGKAWVSGRTTHKSTHTQGPHVNQTAGKIATKADKNATTKPPPAQLPPQDNAPINLAPDPKQPPPEPLRLDVHHPYGGYSCPCGVSFDDLFLLSARPRNPPSRRRSLHVRYLRLFLK